MRTGLPILKVCFPWPKKKPDRPANMTGWFAKPKQVLLAEVVPHDVKLLVELGSWFGQSTRWFLKHCPKATVIAVDTWLGSCEHIKKKRLLIPTLYETFLVNQWEWRNRLVPFRNTSLAALNFIHALGLKPDVIYFDSDHSVHGLFSELGTARDLFPDAMMVGDDYEKGNSVAKAIDMFMEWDLTEGDDPTLWADSSSWKVETLNHSWHIDKGK